MTFCNHVPGVFCQYCYSMTITPDSVITPHSVGTFPAGVTLRQCGKCISLTAGEVCPKCGDSLVQPQPSFQPPTATEADILKQLGELRTEMEEIQEDLRYLLSHVAPAGSRRRKKRV